MPLTLDGWLAHLERLHPVGIELGLDRVQAVAARLNLDFSGKQVVTVAGTNGKGSTVSLLRSVLNAAGHRVATYTSPHLHIYNERVCVDGIPVSDECLCEGFAAVERAREDISLTYFEFGTLAALHHFASAPVDYVVLEVGLGGRLDAVNIIDADLAILTNVALDHMDWLGDTREKIGHEKAGIFRSGRPALYGESDMPASVAETAATLGAQLYRQGQAYGLSADPDGQSVWRGGKAGERRYGPLPETLFNPDTLSTVIQALSLLLPDLPEAVLFRGIMAARLPGRLQHIARGPVRQEPETVLDVAHNPHAIHNLLGNLERHFAGRPLSIVMAMLADKDIDTVTGLMAGLDACWYVARVEDARSAATETLRDHLLGHGVRRVSCHDSVAEAYRQACADASDDTLVLVTGSFFTVADVLSLLATAGRS